MFVIFSFHSKSFERQRRRRRRQQGDKISHKQLHDRSNLNHSTKARYSSKIGLANESIKRENHNKKKETLKSRNNIRFSRKIGWVLWIIATTTTTNKREKNILHILKNLAEEKSVRDVTIDSCIRIYLRFRFE